MLLIISDASVLIDIEHSKLTSAMFSLPYQFAVPDILYMEELAKRHGTLLQSGLINKRMNGELIAEAYNLRQQYSKLSVNDLLALTLAKSEKSQLLTGDRALRDVANIFNIKVHGTIWLVEQMLEYKKISLEVARLALQRMRDSGSRLPWKEFEKFLDQYEKKYIEVETK